MDNLDSHNTSHRPYRVGLALSGGGARGFAHVGVLRALEEIGIKPDIIAGTSAGAIVAALYADGYTPQHLLKLFNELDVKELVEMTLPRNSLLKIDKFIKFLESKLYARRIEDLKIPTLIVATDFDHGKSVAFHSGDLSVRVAASCSIPIMFPPIAIDGVNYVDGGVLRNLPATHIRELCDVLIGVNVSPMRHEKYDNNLISIADRAYNFLSCGNVFPDLALCDVVIEHDDVGDYRVYDLKEYINIEELGYRQAIDTLSRLLPEKKKLLNI